MTESPPEPQRHRGLRLPILVCLVLNCTLFAFISLRNPLYLIDYRQASNPDAHHYVLIGRNFFLEGAYSRNDSEPFIPDMLRTPVYPLFAGGLDLLGRAGAIYLVQVLLHAGSCTLLFVLVRACFGPRPAFWASLFLATDLTLIATNFEPMSEALFVFLVLAVCVCLLPGPEGVHRLWSGRRSLFGGVLLGLAILTRPAALYLPMMVALAYLASGITHRQLARALGHVLLWTVPAGLLVGLWIARNSAVCGVTKLTTVDTNNLIYFVGAGAYQVRHGLTLEEAQARIAQEYRILSYREAQNDHLGDRRAAEIHATLQPIAKDVLLNYPRELMQASVVAVFKANVGHATAELAHLLSLHWDAPGMGGLVKGEPEALQRLGGNPPLLLTVFVWQLLHVGLVLLLALIGLLTALGRRELRGGGLVLLAILGYFTLTVALFGYEAFYRCRLPAQPFLFAFAGLANAREGRRDPSRTDPLL